MKHLQELFSEKPPGLWREASDLRGAPGIAAAEGRGGRAAPWPLALSLQLVVRRQMMREPTPGKIIDPPNQRFPGKSGNDTPPLGRHHHGHDDKKNFYKWEKKAQL